MFISFNTPFLTSTFESSIAKDDLISLSSDITEAAIDSFMDPGFLSEVPFCGMFVKLWKTGICFRDVLFIKKVMLFLSKVQETPLDKREEFLRAISLDLKSKNKLFEKVLIALDKHDDSDKSVLLSVCFNQLVLDKFNKYDFFRISRFIDDMMIEEIRLFFLIYTRTNFTKEEEREYAKLKAFVNLNDLDATIIRIGIKVEQSRIRENPRDSSK